MASDMDLGTMQRILTEALGVLCEPLNPGRLLVKLKVRHALEWNEVEVIKKLPTKEEQVDLMLGTLRKKPLLSYKIFMEELQKEREDLFEEVKKIERTHLGVGKS